MPSAPASCSWLIASILRRIRTRAPTCWSVGLGAFFRGNGKRTAMADRSLKLSSKNRPDAGTFDIPIQRPSFEQKVLPFRVFDIGGASTGSPRECRFLDNDLHFLDSHLLICALG